MDMSDVVALAAVRTPMGKFGGTLRYVPPFDLGSIVVRQAMARAQLPGKQVDEVILGTCRQAGNGPNPARTAAVRAGIPISVPAVSINMACPSAMRAIALGAQAIRLGDAGIVVAGGFESMSTIPYFLKNVRWDGFKLGNKKLEDGWSDSIDPLIGQGMGETAENLCDKYKISRALQDEFAAESHLKAARAQANGWFDEEIVPVELPGNGKVTEQIFTRDETIRAEINREKMAQLKPVFRANGAVTAANACQMGDGAAAVILTHRKRAEELCIKPLFSLMTIVQTATEPKTMGEGPALAIPAALDFAGMSLDDMDLIEVNEAFAIQVLANEKVLGWNREKLNIHGGAIALSHPTGISGARIVVTLYHALKRLGKTLGLAAICGAGGVAMATIIKREF